MKKQEFTGSRVVIDEPAFALHQFSEGPGVPFFIVPPHAGRHGNIAQRMIDKCVTTGRPVFAYELKHATFATRDTSIKDLTDFIYICHDYIGEVVDLIGLCQGGWLSTIYTVLYPDLVRKLALHATPINTQADPDNAIEKYMRTPFVLEYHKMIVTMNHGLQLGFLQWLSFAMVRPEEIFSQRYKDRDKLIEAGDTKGLEKWERNNDWYDFPVTLAGKWFNECMDNHFKNNRLFKGGWIVAGQDIQLSDIKCPLFLYAGEIDPITSIPQMLDMAKKVSSEEVHTTIFPEAGHTKVFVGTKELKHFASEFF